MVPALVTFPLFLMTTSMIFFFFLLFCFVKHCAAGQPQVPSVMSNTWPYLCYRRRLAFHFEFLLSRTWKKKKKDDKKGSMGDILLGLSDQFGVWRSLRRPVTENKLYIYKKKKVKTKSKVAAPGWHSPLGDLGLHRSRARLGWLLWSCTYSPAVAVIKLQTA